MNIKIGTRGSKLALTQTTYVKNQLTEAFPMHTFEIVVIKTTGDLVVDRPISKIGNKGVFVREIEEKLLSGEIQLGVHSMKDMPAKPADGLTYTKAWKREDPRDVLILREVSSFEELPQNAVIGTGSYRRQSQLKKMRNDLNFKDIRGNVDTRIKKMHEEKLDGIVLAAAGLHRLGMQDVITQYLSFDEMVPSPAQGILALEIRNDDHELEEMLNSLSDEESEYAASAERTFLKEMDADCTIPVGAVCHETKDEHELYVFYTQPNQENLYTLILKGRPAEKAELFAKRAAFEVRKNFAGTVFLVGAGPGDEKLITRKGFEAIEEADCILYDRLASPQLLSYAKKTCEMIYVGKANHNHAYPQEQINQMLIQNAMKYKKILRLKGGDVYVFGRGSEEAVALKHAGVPFEIIPGVSSAIAGLAYAGIPITSRGVSRGFTVVTAKNKQDELADIDFSSMTKKDHTYVFLMGLSSLDEIARRLMSAGKDKMTPVAVISNATLFNQQTVVSTLDGISDEVKSANLPSPALIVVGDVVTYREELNFFEEKPFFQKRCFLPYLGEEKNELSKQLSELGAYVEEVNVGEITFNPIPLEVMKDKQKKWLIFTSKNGVKSFFEQLKKQDVDLRNLADTKFAVIGKKTKEALANYGFCEDFMPEMANVIKFCEEFANIVQKSDAVYLLKAKNDDHYVLEHLADKCEFHETYAYENVETKDIKQTDLFSMDYFIFTCASSVERICKNLEEDIRKELDEKKQIFSIGPNCTKELEKYGFKHIYEAKESSYDGLITVMMNTLYN